MNKKKIAMFPGSFNPIHAGHIDIIKRASKLFDKLYVVVSINDYKKYRNKLCDRYAIVKKQVAKLHLKNVVVVKNNGITAAFAKKHNISIVVRSIRDAKDAQYEIDVANVTHTLNKNIETVLLLSRTSLNKLSSTAIRYLKDVKKKK